MKLLVSVLTLSFVATAISAAAASTDTDICGGKTEYTGTSTAASGTVVSPNKATDATNYGDDLDCTLTITTEDAGIQLTFSQMDVENARNCANDYVQITVGEESTEYCAYTIPTVASISGKTVKITFKTDGSVGHKGFKLAWAKSADAKCLAESGACQADACDGTTVEAVTGDGLCTDTAKSNCCKPKADAKCVAASGACQADACDGTTVEAVTGDGLCTEKAKSNCCKTKSTTTTAIDICGGQTTYPYTGTSSDASGTVKSPNYPKVYPASVDGCTLTITTANAGISLTFTHMNIENARSCKNDYVEITVGEESTKYCAYTIPTVADITGNTVTIKFVSDSSDQKTGFELSWKGTGK